MDRVFAAVDVLRHGMSTLTLEWHVGDVVSQGGPIGCIFDAYGPTWLLCSGSVVLVASLVLTSVCVHFYQYLLAQGFLFGLGVAMLCVWFSCAKCKVDHDLAFTHR